MTHLPPEPLHQTKQLLSEYSSIFFLSNATIGRANVFRFDFNLVYDVPTISDKSLGTFPVIYALEKLQNALPLTTIEVGGQECVLYHVKRNNHGDS